GHDAGSDEAANDLPAGASEVSIATRNSSGFSMTIVSPAGSPVAGSSTLTVITGCPGDNRRLRAIDGCGGDISTLTAAAGMAFSTVPNDGNSCSASWPASGPGSVSWPASGSLR